MIKKKSFEGLPLYDGGIRDEFVYDAGRGLHEEPLDGEAGGLPMLWDVPYLEERMAPFSLYEGFTIEKLREDENGAAYKLTDGPRSYVFEKKGEDGFLTPDPANPKPTEEPVLVHTVRETSEAEFEAYLDKLAIAGWSGKPDGKGVSFYKNGRHLYAYYLPRTKTARIVEDDISCRADGFGYDCASTQKVKLIQFSLKYGKMIRCVTADCGMLYLFILPDNSVFFVDGGEKEQATDAAIAELMDVLRFYTKTPAWEKIRIAAWYCTHAHDDHMDGFVKLLRLHHDEIALERVIFNFTGMWRFPWVNQRHILCHRISQYFPDAKYMKIHTGQSFSLAGVRFDCLLTHEDTLNSPAGRECNDFNEGSTVLKLSFDGTRFLLLGDINKLAAKLLMENYDREELIGSGVQAAHHLINLLPELYRFLMPCPVLVPGESTRADPEDPRYTALTDVTDKEKIYFASEETLVFEAVDGKLEVIDRRPQVGGAYDGSKV